MNGPMADELSAPLLALHKAVLATERRNVERIHGAMSAAEFLQVVSDPLRYGWLKPLTELGNGLSGGKYPAADIDRSSPSSSISAAILASASVAV